jgi:hypothetical protein
VSLLETTPLVCARTRNKQAKMERGDPRIVGLRRKTQH